MQLNKKSLEKLRELINEETQYRKGFELVNFFNDLGSNDIYGQGFPSRWQYTDDKLLKLNGTADLDKCIKILFAPINYIGQYEKLDDHIKDFNQFIAFDKWQVIRNNAEITFKRADSVKIDSTETKTEIGENDFLGHEFKDVIIDSIGLDSTITSILNFLHMEEIQLG